jgi:hypothetical protein
MKRHTFIHKGPQAVPVEIVDDMTDEETEEYGPQHVENQNSDVDEQMKDCVDQARQVEAQYAAYDSADILYDVQDAANDLLDGVYRPAENTAHDIVRCRL